MINPHGAWPGAATATAAGTYPGQHDAWQVDTSDGPVFVRISREPRPDESAESFRRLARPALPGTGRFAHVSDMEHVASRNDVLRVLAEMRSDLAGAGATEWENPTLDRFLEAFGGFLGDIDGYFANRAEPAPAQPSWSLLATVLVAATGYE